MDYDALINALDAAIHPESDDFKKAVTKSEKYPPELSRSMLLHELSGSIADQLKTDSEFEKGFMVNLDNGSTGFQADPVAKKLLDLALIDSSQIAVEWLAKVLATKSATGIVISVVWGLAANSVIQLTDELSIVPMTFATNPSASIATIASASISPNTSGTTASVTGPRETTMSTDVPSSTTVPPTGA